MCLLPMQPLRKQKCSVTAVQPMVRRGSGLTAHCQNMVQACSDPAVSSQELLSDQRKADGAWLMESSPKSVSCSVSLTALGVMPEARLSEIHLHFTPCDPLLSSQDQPSCASESLRGFQRKFWCLISSLSYVWGFSSL